MVPHFDAELRVRVERLLSDQFRVDDLTTLFLALRDRADGRETVIEVGDFVAHRDKRTKGIVTRTLRDWFTITRFIFGPERNQMTIDHLPSNIDAVLQASFRRTEHATIRRDTGMSRVAASGVLKELVAKVRRRSTGGCYLWLPTSNDLRLLGCLTSHVRAIPAFDEERLFDEFTSTLISNKLISARGARALSSLKGTIALFALTHMHRSVIDLGDGNSARLEATPSGDRDGRIVVLASATIDAQGLFNVNGPIYATSQTVTASCEPGMEGPSWPYPLEITPAKLLGPLGKH